MKGWVYHRPPSQKVWDIMLAIVSGEDRNSICNRFEVSSPYVSKVAREFGISKPQNRKSPKRINQAQTIIPKGSYAELRLGEHVSLIDFSDAELIAPFKWYVHSTGYVYKTTAPTRLHVFLLGQSPDKIVDHINGDRMDNRRSNLRYATNAQNSANSASRKNSASPYKGVRKFRHKWAAGLRRNGVSQYLGVFDCEIEAALAFDAAARKLNSPFERFNFPQDGELSALLGGEKNLRGLINHNGAAA